MSTAAAGLPSFADFASGGGLFLWVNTSGRPCPGPAGGCEARNDVRRTLEEWVALGLPRTGWSYCKHRCHCVLLPLIPFGLQIAEELDQPGASIKPSESISPPARFDATKPFAEQGNLGSDVLAEALRGLPLVGGMRAEVESIILALEDGTLSYQQALELLDDLFSR